MNPHEHGASMSWQLKAGESASAAISAWIDGPTIADTAVAATARGIDDVRLAIGDNLFDRLFGSADQAEDAQIAMHTRLHIKADHGNLVQNMQKIGYDAQRAAISNTGSGKVIGGDLDNDDLSYFSDDKQAETAPPQEMAETELGAETAQAERAEVSAMGIGDATYADAYVPEVAVAEAVTVPAQVTVPEQVTVPTQVTVPERAPEGFLASATEQIESEDQKKSRVGA